MSAYVPAARGEDLLYQVLDEHLQTFFAACDEDGVRVPRYAREEFEDYLACGMPEHGFALLRCDGCGTARAVAFSCKRRGFCPSCTGRRMNQGAAHLVDNVCPRAPVLQWVLSLPMPLRFRLAWDGELGREVLATVLSAVFAYYRDATGLPDGRGGAVMFEQSFGSSLNANLHFYALLRARGLLDDEGEPAQDESDDGQHVLLSASLTAARRRGTSTCTPRSASRPTTARPSSGCVATSSGPRCRTTGSLGRPTESCS